MEIADAETESSGGLKPAARCVHADGRRCERIVGRKHQRAPVFSALIRRIGRASQYVVPPAKDESAIKGSQAIILL